MHSKIETSAIPKPRYPALSLQDTTYSWNTDLGRYTHGWAKQVGIMEDEEEEDEKEDEVRVWQILMMFGRA
jgi:hypothetical protein